MLSNQVAGVVGGERIDEGFIDFKDIDVQRVQIMQIRVAGAEIVDGNFIACFAERRITGVVFGTSINPRSVTSILICPIQTA